MTFKKGKSGNPKGRPKADFELRDACRAHGTEALTRLLTLMRSNDEKVARAASDSILDRGYGKATQMLGSDPINPLIPVAWPLPKSDLDKA